MKCCWWCTLEIEGEALGLPYKYNERTRKFNTMGQFCSWECMKAFNIDSRNHKSFEVSGFITLYRKQMYGKYSRLKCAPSRWCLEKFGGTMTPEEFRSSFSENPPAVLMPHTEKFIHKPLEKKTYVQEDSAQKKKARLENIKNSSAKTETLRLKRPTPIQHKSNNLESILGLKRKPTC